MRLNRARALMLVSTLAVGCTINQVADDGGDDDGSAGESNAGSGGSGKGGTGGSSGSGGKGGSSGSSGSSGGDASAGETSSSGAPGAAGEAAGGAAGEGAGGAGDGVGGDDGSAGEAAGNGGASAGSDGGGGEAGGAPTCDDEAGSVASCDGLADLSSCGIADFVEGECTDADTYLKPAVANAKRECMLELDEAELCDATNTYECLNDAMLASCPDSTAAAFCEDLGAECGGNVPENCETYVSGLTAEGRAQFTACVEDGWCDLYICAESLGTY